MTRRTLFRSFVGLAAAPPGVELTARDQKMFVDALLNPPQPNAKLQRASLFLECEKAVRAGMMTIDEARELMLDNITEDLIINGDPDAPKPQGILRALE